MPDDYRTDLTDDPHSSAWPAEPYHAENTADDAADASAGEYAAYAGYEGYAAYEQAEAAPENGWQDDLAVASAILAEDDAPLPLWANPNFIRLIVLFIVLAVLAALVVFVLFPLVDLWLNPPPPPPLPPPARL